MLTKLLWTLGLLILTVTWIVNATTPLFTAAATRAVSNLVAAVVTAESLRHNSVLGTSPKADSRKATSWVEVGCVVPVRHNASKWLVLCTRCSTTSRQNWHHLCRVIRNVDTCPSLGCTTHKIQDKSGLFSPKDIRTEKPDSFIFKVPREERPYTKKRFAVHSK